MRFGLTFLRHALFLMFSLLIAGGALAQGERPTYDLDPPLATENPGKVEVVEFFWYGCPHCYALEPSLQEWIEKLPKDVAFKRIPAIFNENWAVSARVYYTLEALGELPRLHRAFFDAIHKDGFRPTDESDLVKWMKDHGVDANKYKDTSKSFAVEGRMSRAKQLIDAAKVSGVPAIVVQGRHVINADTSPLVMLGRVDKFIDQERKGLRPAAPATKPRVN